MTACRMFASHTRMAMAACSLRGLAVPLLRRFDTVFLVRARLQSTQELPVQPKKDLVRVEATIIEKTETWPKISFHYKARKREQRKHVITTPQTGLRINSIDIAPTLR
uniref:large ribosomal subunit protein bL21m-like n=1 Tax=Myxine glutinosa TaxID=7769 RepID=UPI00358F65E2